MNYSYKRMTSALVVATAAAATMGATAARADGYREVHWSIAMVQPGLQVAVSNVPMAPVWVGYGLPYPHVHQPVPVVVTPPQVVVVPSMPPRGHHGRGWHHDRHHGHGHGHDGNPYAQGSRAGHERHGGASYGLPPPLGR